MITEFEERRSRECAGMEESVDCGQVEGTFVGGSFSLERLEG